MIEYFFRRKQGGGALPGGGKVEEESLKRSQVEEHCTVEEAQPPCEKLSCGVEHGNLLPGSWQCSNSPSWDLSMVFEVWLSQL